MEKTQQRIEPLVSASKAPHGRSFAKDIAELTLFLDLTEPNGPQGHLEAATAVTRGNEARYEDFSRQVREEHEAIVAAIRAGDEMAARNAAQTHMFNAARRLSQGQS